MTPERLEKKLMNAAVAYLGRYASSAENLRRVLRRKLRKWLDSADFDGLDTDQTVDRVIGKCTEFGLLDDVQYAETKVASLRRRGRSERRIRATLAAKGVDRDIASAAVQSDETEERQAAHTYARRRRLGPWRPAELRRDRREKDIAAMCRAGFSVSLAREVIDGPGASDAAARDLGDQE